MAQPLSKPPSPSAPLPPVSKCSPLKRWCPICHMWAKRDHALLFSITEFSSCQLRWDRRRSRWVAVSTINQHEIFSFEYTHHLQLLPLSLLETPQKELGCLSEVFCKWDHVLAVTQFLIYKREKKVMVGGRGLYSGDTIFLNVKL